MEVKTLGAVGYTQPVLPANYGQWSGMPGRSNWVYDLTAQRWDAATNGRNTWGAMIARTLFPNETHTAFQGGFPNFRSVLITLTCPGEQDLDAVYTYPAGQQLSASRSQNMNAADWWVANHFHCTVGSVTSLRSANLYTWHEEEDLKHIILVPWEIHGNVHHSGGIDVIHSGGIGASGINFSGLESRRFEGVLLYRLNGTWLERRAMRAEGTLREVQCTYICNDPDAGPTDGQLRAANSMTQQWEDTLRQAWPSIEAYAAVMDPPGKGTDWQAAPEEMVIYPEDSSGHVEIGILYGFSLDKEHGAGVRLRDGKIVMVGSGDVAL